MFACMCVSMYVCIHSSVHEVDTMSTVLFLLVTVAKSLLSAAHADIRLFCAV